jgi:hypothetical protein
VGACVEAQRIQATCSQEYTLISNWGSSMPCLWMVSLNNQKSKNAEPIGCLVMWIVCVLRWCQKSPELPIAKSSREERPANQGRKSSR